MAFKFKIAPAPTAIPSPRVLPTTTESEAEVATAVRIAEAERHAAMSAVSGPNPKVTEDGEGITDETSKLSQLIADDFPFDDSQLAAIHGMLDVLKRAIEFNRNLYSTTALTPQTPPVRGACMTGAAGTGKTTSTKKLVDEIRKLLTGAVDMESYFNRGEPDDDDNYEIVERWVPAICMCGFTGRSTQMIKKNFPRDWHQNIMTIHRMLAYMPEFYEEFDDESGMVRNKMRFIPTYDANNKLPWKVIIIDEAGMVGLDLWHNIVAAMEPDTLVIMIGDINQLPPVHGRSVFGFAMSEWPSWELTHIHRQEGKDNPIVDNAWRILKGEMPVSGGAFQMVKFDGLASKASQQVRKLLPTLQEKGVYDPIRDTTITPINGEDGSRGFALGQLPLNREFAIIFNNTEERYIIDAGRERKQFAVGDKVMATRNDHEVGITNGMTGIITSIVENGAYTGDRHRFGRVKDVNAYMAGVDDGDEDEDIDLDALNDSMDAMNEGLRAAKEKKERGPSSHIVTVKFGFDEHAFEIPFGSLAEVASLMTAYVVTCHKMQGGESPVIVIICHDAHKQMLNREWLYTAVTRASQKCILLYTDGAIKVALNKQRISGKTLAEKVKVFKDLSTKGLLGAAVDVNLNWWGPRAVVSQDRSHELDSLAQYEGEAPLVAPTPANDSIPLETVVETVAQVAAAVAKQFVAEHSNQQSNREDPALAGAYSEYDRAWEAQREKKLAELDSRFEAAKSVLSTPKCRWVVPVGPVESHGRSDRRGKFRMARILKREQKLLRLPAPMPMPVEPAKAKVPAFMRRKG